MDVKDSEIIVSGYHRDVFSGGTLEDVTTSSSCMPRVRSPPMTGP